MLHGTVLQRVRESLRLEKVSKTLNPVINPALPCLPLSIPAPPSGFGACWLFIGKLEEDEFGVGGGSSAKTRDP